MTTDVASVVPPGRTVQESIAQTIVPYPRDDARARYLGLRACGFTIREALKLMGYAHSTLSLWRQTPQFVELELKLPEYRRQLAAEYIALEFKRNFRLVMEKDFLVIKKSLDKVRGDDGKYRPVALLPQEQQYLLKLRGFYTPQQLQILEALAGLETGSKELNWTELVLAAQKVQQSVTVRASRTTETVEVSGGTQEDQ